MSEIDRAGRLDSEPLASVVERLRRERDGLREAMRTRALIEQAKGVLMARHGIDADAAFERLRRTSQQTNVRLAELAATVVAEVSPSPTDGSRGPSSDPAEPRAAVRRDGRRPGRGRTGAARSPQVTADPAEDPPQVRHLLLASRLAAAGDYDAVVAALAEVAPAWPAPASVVLVLPEPDGALRVVASHGLSAETASQWIRIPPQVEVPLTATARTGEPVWLADREELARAYPVMPRLADVAACVTLPLAYRHRLLGVVGFSWHAALDLDGTLRAYLRAAADLTARAVARLAATAPDHASAPDAVPDQLWIQPLLDGVLTPAALLRPVRAGGTVADFVVERANSAAVAAALARGIRLLGATLLTVVPEVGLRTLLPLCQAVLADGRPRQFDDLHLAGSGSAGSDHYAVRVVRLGDRLQLSWRPWSPAELMYEDMVAAGRAVRVAAFRWHLATGELRGSPNLPLLLDWPQGRSLTPGSVGEALDPADWPKVRRAVVDALRTGEPVRLVVCTRRGDRWLRVVAERITDAGRPVALRGHLQDVTRLRSVRIPPPASGARRPAVDPPAPAWPV